MNKKYIFLYFILLVIVAATSTCKNKKEAYSPPQDPLFTKLSAKETNIQFTNAVVDDSMMNVFNYRNFYNGGGVAIGDINNDGLADIYFTSNQNKNQLFLNKGNWKFDDITDKAGVGGTMAWSTGVTMADVNGDRWLDIYVCNSGNILGDKRENELFINNQNGTFTERSHEYNLADPGGFHTHVVFFDYDLDGDLDCYLLNNSYFPVDKITNREIRNVRDPLAGDKLFRNDGLLTQEGSTRFTDVSEQAGIYGSLIGFGLGVNVGDINNDMWPDIYISNDFFEKDYLYINNKDGTFKEVIDSWIQHTSQSSMGADMADINNDGLVDIFSTDMLPEGDIRLKTTTRFDDFDFFNSKVRGSFHRQFLHNGLQLNNGDSTFSEISELSGVNATDWSWGALIFDFDNDGWKDIFVSNGIYKDLTNQDYIDFLQDAETRRKVSESGVFNLKEFLDKLPSTPVSSYGFINQGNLLFSNQSYNLGLSEPSFSNGAAYGDLDNDGDLDLVVNNVNLPASVFMNNAGKKEGNNYLRIILQGDGKNTLGVGAVIKAYAGRNEFLIQQQPTRGFESSVDPVLSLGLGKHLQLDSLIIIWPDLRKQIVMNVKTNQQITLHQPDAKELFIPPPVIAATLFTPITATTISGDYTHHENAFIDFDKERLIPKMLSTEGPKLAVGDINNDGLEDIIMGGAKEDTTRLFLQTKNGKFIQSTQKAFEVDKDYENTGLELSDIDMDGDLDLLAASGGNEDIVGAYTLSPRLYLNDGKGNFLRTVDNLPMISVNASCIKAADVDGDGDPDIFIGGRSIPGSYGKIPGSYLLLNNGGFFTDATHSKAPGLQQVGMITDAQWIDIDNDKSPDLILVGDWMNVTILKNKNGKLTEPQKLPQSSGWWNALQATDIDGDGDIDLIAGNQGSNCKIKVSPDKPGKLFVNDFDKNGQSECVPVYYKTDGKAYPFNLRGELTQQIPSLKKKFLYYNTYAGKNIEEVFTKEQLASSTQLIAEEFQSCIFINDGKGSFSKQPLPLMAQISPVFSILVFDYNNDGKKDILLGGNFFGVKPELGRFDASYSILLKGEKNNQFTFIPNMQTGMIIKEEVRDIKIIQTAAKQTYILFARNNESLQIYKKK